MRLEESLESTHKRIAGLGEAMEAFKRRRSMLDYRIQQLFKGSSEGSSINLEVPDEPKNNFGSSSTSLSESDDEVQDVYSDEENKSDGGCSHSKTVQVKLEMLCWWEDKRDGLQTAYADNLTFSFCHANIEVQFRSLSLKFRDREEKKERIEERREVEEEGKRMKKEMKEEKVKKETRNITYNQDEDGIEHKLFTRPGIVLNLFN
ncbi:hypothetical protein Tco_0717362 [Tanacetum coccineum]